VVAFGRAQRLGQQDLGRGQGRPGGLQLQQGLHRLHLGIGRLAARGGGQAFQQGRGQGVGDGQLAAGPARQQGRPLLARRT
jgi:hypothetical protein